ncbi:MAG: hypothetical protein ACLFM0_04945 [Spirochaetales bacterium]
MRNANQKETVMRRTLEVVVLAVFIAVGLGAITGRLPLPRLDIDAASFAPFEASTDSASGCASCTADCPLAGGESEDTTRSDAQAGARSDVARVSVHQALSGRENLPSEIGDASAAPLPGGVLTETRRGVDDNGRPRIWIDIATSSPIDEAISWYKAEFADAGWELRHDQPEIVPGGEFLSFERNGSTINVLFETDEKHTRVFVDYPDDLS